VTPQEATIPAAIPTLSFPMLALLALALFVAGLFVIRRP
jgi:hypothetical protein